MLMISSYVASKGSGRESTLEQSLRSNREKEVGMSEKKDSLDEDYIYE